MHPAPRLTLTSREVLSEWGAWLRWRERNLLNLAFLAGIALLILGIASVWWGGGGDAPGNPSAKGPEVPLAPILRDQEPLSAFAVVSDRNLFSPDRKGPAKGPAKKQDSLEGYRLLGTMVIGHTRAALIGGKIVTPGRAGADVEVVYMGQEWGGYKVVAILKDSVVFQGKDGRRTLNFPE
jgi:hypothetical protein